MRPCGCGASRCPTCRGAGLKLAHALATFGVDAEGAGGGRRGGLHRGVHRLSAAGGGGPGVLRGRGAGAARLEDRLRPAGGRDGSDQRAAPRPATRCPSPAIWRSSMSPSSPCGWCCRRWCPCCVPAAPLVTLVKPQFEVGPRAGGQGRHRARRGGPGRRGRRRGGGGPRPRPVACSARPRPRSPVRRGTSSSSSTCCDPSSPWTKPPVAKTGGAGPSASLLLP